MKKTILFAMMFVTSFSQAVTINWGGAGIITDPFGTQITSSVASGLVIQMWVVGVGEESDHAVDSKIPTFATKGARELNALASQFVGYTTLDVFYFRAFATFLVDDGNGGEISQNFYMDIWNTGGVGKGWSFTGDWSDVGATADWTASFVGKTFGGTGDEGSVGKWIAVPVPEPATAAMALAGLALLFRRKRK